MIYVTSDLHFGHDRSFVYTPRGFDNIQDHDEAIIERWNLVVNPEDTVYILGDLMLKDNAHGIECLKRLNGEKKYIAGNHDTLTRLELYNQNGLTFLGFADKIKYKGYHFYMSHYPTLTGNLDDSGLKHMTLNLFGHTHQTTNFYEDRPYMYHVGVDSHNCYPVSLDSIIEDMKEKAEECKEML